MMRLRKIIKEFVFEEENRTKITLGSNTRLNPDENWLQLKEQSDGLYLTDSDLYVKTWVVNPLTVKKWIGFQVVETIPEYNLVVTGSLAYRLSDGTDEFFWNGSAWEVNVVDWNTEAEVANNIENFPVASKKLQVVINLKTDNVSYTPLVHRIKVLYESNVEHTEDLVYRSMVPMLRDEIRPRGRMLIKMTSTSDTISLAPIETPYNIASIDSVFDHTNDPDHFVDLYQSYDEGTETITLSTTIAENDLAYVNFLWEPEVAVTTSQDYYEVEKVPVIVLDDINLLDATEQSQTDFVFNKDTGSGWKIKSPLRGDLEFSIRLITDKGIDLLRLADETKRFFANNKVLRSVGLDEEYRLWLLTEYDMTTSANQEELHSARMTCRIVNVLFFEQDAAEAYAVERLNLQGDMDLTVS